MYRRIASIAGKVDYDEMYEELTDRFRNVPKEADYLMRIALLKSNAKDEYITRIVGDAGILRVDLYPKAKVNPEKLVEFVGTYPEKLRFVKGSIPGFELTYKETGLAPKDEENLLKLAEQFVKDMRYIMEENA